MRGHLVYAYFHNGHVVHRVFDIVGQLAPVIGGNGNTALITGMVAHLQLQWPIDLLERNKVVDARKVIEGNKAICFDQFIVASLVVVYNAFLIPLFQTDKKLMVWCKCCPTVEWLNALEGFVKSASFSWPTKSDSCFSIAKQALVSCMKVL